jgi:hypothetical protein
MNYEISPEPDEAERAAILEALAAEEAQQQEVSPWTKALLPGRADKDEPQA